MTVQAEISGHKIEVERNETLLQAALRNGLNFPNACRVGGCGSCKCKIRQGSVRELTETAYLLSQDELDGGVVLACQSVPQTDVVVDVELDSGLRGQVVAQQALTHDTVRITIELEQPLDYRAGQFANVRLEGLEGVTRCYSFASPASDDGRVTFFIRRVPGGVFSSLVNDEDVVGRTAWLEGPHGDFWMRPGHEPLVLVAGGSGLAPILALLKDAAAKGVQRDAVLYFGARTERDLYALDEIAAVEAAWGGDFAFVPVLSQVGPADTWQGRRGLVTEHIEVPAGSQGYICGPPAMVDAARDTLAAQGVKDIFYDRFVTSADAPSQGEDAGVWDYAKFLGFHAVGLLALASLTMGGWWLVAGVASIIVFYVLGDAVLGNDTSTPNYRYPWVLTVQLWMALPLLVMIVFASVWGVCSADVLGFGAMVEALTGYDALAARQSNGVAQYVSAFVGTGLMIGMVGTIPAHELTHRTWDRISMLVGRWLLAFSFDTVFSIEHVYGHHRYVSTTEDPATAPRGRNVYAHIVISTLKGNVSAWHIEARRLKKRRLPVWSWHNAVIRGHAMSVGLVALAAWMGGPVAAAWFVVCALWGKALLEIVNYMEHYGMVREPDQPVQPRHSWNTNRRVSSWAMFNLTRHSHHHAEGEVPYHELEPYAQAPMMIGGYLTTLIVAMVPPLWHRLMTPKVLAWDQHYANAQEKRLAAAANARSGRADLMVDGGAGAAGAMQVEGAPV